MSFPSLRITATDLVPKGAFAEAQALYLKPDRDTTQRLGALLREKNVGVVAHFYMDPELQGALMASGATHVHVSDSLVMADRAIEMVKAGAKSIVVLGVDFMSENVRAMLDASGFPDVPVYRVAAEAIGCSLAESAETPAYDAYLERAAHTPRALHIVYINTSLASKARAQSRVPTITCTSSNVVQTTLAAFAEIEGVEVFFGPDTYMGENLVRLFEALGALGDEAIRAVHPKHDRRSIAALLERFHYFDQGNCVVHHMFGAEVVARVRRDYPLALVTAHLEVPGEMFALALEKREQGLGVVGSTSDILSFIDAKVRQAGEAGPGTLQFVLGTEAGMITSIVARVRTAIADVAAKGGQVVDAEIVFPVASEAIATTSDASLPIVPGVASGEGCSTAGGCATCPYMKMNSLDALVSVLERIDVAPRLTLAPLHPRHYAQLIGGRTVADLGGAPILHMREFQKSGHLPHALVDDVKTRHEPAVSA